MTDREYIDFLKALAGKHVRPILNRELDANYLRFELERLASTVRLLKVAENAYDNNAALEALFDELRSSPLEETTRIMDATGILDALDEAPSLVFGQFRRSVIPAEDIELLRQAGYSDHEIEVFITIAVEHALRLAQPTVTTSKVLDEANEALSAVQQTDISATPAARPSQVERKKRKIFNGIGKILAGAIAGTGNVLLLAGTIAAPNPATGYGAIASGGLAVSGIFAGLGDLRGE